MSTIVDVYLHGSVHLTNPGLEELLADTLSQGVSRSLLGPRGPADSTHGQYAAHFDLRVKCIPHLLVTFTECHSVTSPCANPNDSASLEKPGMFQH